MDGMMLPERCQSLQILNNRRSANLTKALVAEGIGIRYEVSARLMNIVKCYNLCVDVVRGWFCGQNQLLAPDDTTRLHRRQRHETHESNDVGFSTSLSKGESNGFRGTDGSKCGIESRISADKEVGEALKTKR